MLRTLRLINVCITGASVLPSLNRVCPEVRWVSRTSLLRAPWRICGCDASGAAILLPPRGTLPLPSMLPVFLITSVVGWQDTANVKNNVNVLVWCANTEETRTAGNVKLTDPSIQYLYCTFQTVSECVNELFLKSCNTNDETNYGLIKWRCEVRISRRSCGTISNEQRNMQATRKYTLISVSVYNA